MILEVCFPNLLIGELFQAQTVKKVKPSVQTLSTADELHKKLSLSEVMMRPC